MDSGSIRVVVLNSSMAETLRQHAPATVTARTALLLRRPAFCLPRDVLEAASRDNELNKSLFCCRIAARCNYAAPCHSPFVLNVLRYALELGERYATLVRECAARELDAELMNRILPT